MANNRCHPIFAYLFKNRLIRDLPFPIHTETNIVIRFATHDPISGFQSDFVPRKTEPDTFFLTCRSGRMQILHIRKEVSGSKLDRSAVLDFL